MIINSFGEWCPDNAEISSQEWYVMWSRWIMVGGLSYYIYKYLQRWDLPENLGHSLRVLHECQRKWSWILSFGISLFAEEIKQINKFGFHCRVQACSRVEEHSDKGQDWSGCLQYLSMSHLFSSQKFPKLGMAIAGPPLLLPELQFQTMLFGRCAPGQVAPRKIYIQWGRLR